LDSFGVREKLFGCHVIERVMGVRGVIGMAPFEGCRSRLEQRSKPVRVEELRANARVERLDVGVLRRLAGLNEEELHVVLFASSDTLA